MKRHLLLCQPEPEDEDQDDPLAFEICNCCGEPVDTAHKVIIFIFFEKLQKFRQLL